MYNSMQFEKKTCFRCFYGALTCDQQQTKPESDILTEKFMSSDSEFGADFK